MNDIWNDWLVANVSLLVHGSCVSSAEESWGSGSSVWLVVTRSCEVPNWCFVVDRKMTHCQSRFVSEMCTYVCPDLYHQSSRCVYFVIFHSYKIDQTSSWNLTPSICTPHNETLLLYRSSKFEMIILTTNIF